ncbi:MAG: ABC transporter permease [Terracidiphilus sp.]
MRNPFGKAFRGFGAILYKEVLHIRRDQSALFIALIMPLLQMVLLGFGIDTNVRQVKTAVLDEDHRLESRQFIDRLRNSDTFRVVAFVQNDRQLNDAIVAGRVKVGVKIPWDYSDRLLKHEGAQVLVLVDGADSSVASHAVNVATAIGLDDSLQRLLGDRQAMPVEVRPQLLFNPDSRSPNFFLPGLMAALLLQVTTFLTALAVVNEKVNGTLEQLFITPVKPLGLMFGKIVPYLGVGFGELCLILVLLVTAFRVPIHGNVVLLLVLSLPYLFVCLSIGLLVSSKANSQSESFQLSALTFLPTIFFSGYIFPRDTMPLPFYIISFFVPGTYYIKITRGIILRGAGIMDLWTDGLVLLGMGLVLILLAAKRFKKKVIAE